MTHNADIDALVDEVVDLVLAYQGQGVGGPHDAVGRIIAARMAQAWDTGVARGVKFASGIDPASPHNPYRVALSKGHSVIPPGQGDPLVIPFDADDDSETPTPDEVAAWIDRQNARPIPPGEDQS